VPISCHGTDYLQHRPLSARVCEPRFRPRCSSFAFRNSNRMLTGHSRNNNAPCVMTLRTSALLLFQYRLQTIVPRSGVLVTRSLFPCISVDASTSSTEFVLRSVQNINIITAFTCKLRMYRLTTLNRVPIIHIYSHDITSHLHVRFLIRHSG
jgi:hypothetical protein